MPGSLKTQLPFTSVSETLDELLVRLAELTPLKTWIFAEIKNDHWIIRACTDSAFGLKVDQFLTWSESVCRQMIVMGGPQCAEDLKKVDHLAQAPAALGLGIASYLGVPVRIPGQMEGMLCGIDKHIADNELSKFLPLAETFGRVLVGAWAQHLSEDQPTTDTPSAKTADQLTGLHDFSAFRELVHSAARKNRNEPGGILLFSMNPGSAGNHVAAKSEIETAAGILQAATRPQDGLAHVTPGSFAIYLPGISEAGLLSVARRIRVSLAACGINSKWGASWFNDLDQFDKADHALKRAILQMSGSAEAISAQDPAPFSGRADTERTA
ncbi:sensor domain-containing diguanylate cyclase [Xanthomonas arboricola]|uniref:sensor domain-containing diguanylate cyclase n=1 Tax=Xanthomonas arboricola TaxID=56448 RepID=UPI0015E35582|nr:GGDEF domain-containing protein [Xanthomonas arboricola]MEB1609055.1 GGDEF domain-containing protein [Xanthomonas campestris pv. campestris]